MASSTNTQLKPPKTCALRVRNLPTRYKPRTASELELQFEKDSQNEIVLFADAEGKGVAHIWSG